jgi:hypothetical protein
MSRFKKISVSELKVGDRFKIAVTPQDPTNKVSFIGDDKSIYINGGHRISENIKEVFKVL